MSTDWQPDRPPPLQPGQCHVWSARAEDAYPDLCQLLDASERARLATFRRDIDRDQFIVSRGLVRLALATYLERQPSAIQISRACPACGRAHGKPRVVAGGAGEVQFSVSHAAGRIVAAFALATPVGIDIEPLDRYLAVERLMPYALTPDECTVLREMDEKGRREGFLVYWTRKEALLKAVGTGLAVSPSGFAVSAPNEPPRLVTCPRDSRLASWPTMFDLDAGPGFVAAFAVMGDCRATVSVDGSALVTATSMSAGHLNSRCKPVLANATGAIDMAYFTSSDDDLTAR